MSTKIEMTLEDLAPRYAGTYTVTSYVDFLGLLPGDENSGTEGLVREINNLFRNPGEQLLVWLRSIDEVQEIDVSLAPS